MIYSGVCIFQLKFLSSKQQGLGSFELLVRMRTFNIPEGERIYTTACGEHKACRSDELQRFRCVCHGEDTFGDIFS